MDNTFFVGIHVQVAGILGWALAAVVLLVSIAVGAETGYRVYKKYLRA